MNLDSEPLDTDVRMQTKKQKPIHEVRLGLIKAAVWKNETENGVRYNVTFSRIYKKDGDDDWKSTDSFGRDDLLLLGKVADQAHSWICSQNGNPEENHQRAAATRNGDERNYSKVLERLQKYKEQVVQHEKNLQALKKELGNIK